MLIYLLCFLLVVAPATLIAEGTGSPVASASPLQDFEVMAPIEEQRERPVDYVEQTISSYCKCAKPSLQVYKDIAEAMKRGDVETLQSIQPRMPALATKLHQCDEYLRNEVKRRKTIKNFWENVSKGIEQRCPRQ